MNEGHWEWMGCFEALPSSSSLWKDLGLMFCWFKQEEKHEEEVGWWWRTKNRLLCWSRKIVSYNSLNLLTNLWNDERDDGEDGGCKNLDNSLTSRLPSNTWVVQKRYFFIYFFGAAAAKEPFDFGKLSNEVSKDCDRLTETGNRQASSPKGGANNICAVEANNNANKIKPATKQRESQFALTQNPSFLLLKKKFNKN